MSRRISRGASCPGGGPVTDSPATPVQNATLTFGGVANQRVSVSIAGNTIAQIRLHSPERDGAHATGRAVDHGHSLDAITPAAETYTLVVDRSGAHYRSTTLTL